MQRVLFSSTYFTYFQNSYNKLIFLFEKEFFFNNCYYCIISQTGFILVENLLRAKILIQILQKNQEVKYFVTRGLEHRFLTGGPWRGSRGSVKITKVKYCCHLNLFYMKLGVNTWQPFSLQGSVDFFFGFSLVS